MTTNDIKVLVVDDDELSFETVRLILKKSPFCQYEVQWLSNTRSAYDALAQNSYDVYIVDYRLGADDGIELIKNAKKHGNTRPIIVVTGFEDSKTDERALAAGAVEFISKDLLNSAFLERTVRYTVEHDRIQKKILDQQVAYIHEFKLSTLGKMTACIAHEIKNPLAVLVGELFILKEELKHENLNREKIAVKVSKLERNTTRIVKIVRSLNLGAQNAENYANEVVPIHTLINEAQELCAAKIKLDRITLQIGDIPANATVDCNPVDISSVIVNLINNAIDAVSTLQERWIKVEVELAGTAVVLSVTDSGAGISAESQLKIFLPFFSTKGRESGLGLGLSLCKQIVEKHHGTLSICNTSQNTKFIVTLPHTNIDRSSPANQRILVVDDDTDILNHIAQELAKVGYNVNTAQNGLKALDLLKTTNFDILISDIIMPGIRGDELISQANTFGVLPVKVVGITGYNQLTLATPSKNCHIQLLRKPFSINELIKLVREPLTESLRAV